MPIIKLRNLGSVGLNTDMAPESLNPLAFTLVKNMSFYDQAPQKAKGYTSNAFTALPITPYSLMPAQGPTDYTWVILGLAKAYAFYNGALNDITRVASDYSSSVFIPWTGAWVNGVTFINNGQDVPQFVSTIDGSAKFADLTNWNALNRCRCLRAFKNFVIAMDVTKDGTRYPTLFKWSHPADPGGVPPSWDETDAQFLAGEFPLSSTPGRLIDGVALKNSFIVYKSDGIIAVRETGDNDIFRFDSISSKFGVPAVNCVTEFQPGTHAFITQTGDLMINNGQGVRSIASNKVRKLIRGTVDSSSLDRSFCFTDVRNTEVVFCFATQGADWPNFGITWNWEEKTFGQRSFAPISAVGAGKFNIVVAGGEAWDVDGAEWDGDTGSWDGVTENVISNRIIGVSPSDVDSYLLGEGYTADGAITESFVQRKTLPVVGQDIAGNLTLDPRVVKLVTKVWPIIEVDTDEAFIVRIGMQDSASGSITWQTMNDFRPKRDEYLEPFCEGRYVSYHVQNTGTSNWKLVGFDMEIVLNGENF
jgi:hypothetical protein